MTHASKTTSGIAYDRAGPTGDTAVVLLHAGIADRRMWEPIWSQLTAERDVVRLDLRGYGESTQRPSDTLSPVADVLETISELGIDRAHLVGASFGAGVAVETALTHPAAVESLLLCAPGGSLISSITSDLQEFIDTEDEALESDDLDAAAEANVAWWVDSPHRVAGSADPAVRDGVRAMQRLAFELTADWDDIDEEELDPAPLERLDEVRARTLLLVGGYDLRAIHDTARQVAADIPDVRRVDWPDVAHLPSMERPSDFVALLRNWLDNQPVTADSTAARPEADANEPIR